MKTKKTYNKVISKLFDTLPFLNDIAIIGINNDIIYSTNTWDLKSNIDRIINNWNLLKRDSILISGKEYSVRSITIDRLIASSIKGDGHIVGVKDNERIIITLIEHDGIVPFTTMELMRILGKLSYKEPYLDKNVQFGIKEKISDIILPLNDNLKEISTNSIQKNKNLNQRNNQLTHGVPFTARLMAFYRAQENEKNQPLLLDPFAKQLAGDLSMYMKQHLRLSEMDYPIVRSFYIENTFLEPWCVNHEQTQIIMLGAGLDTRAYRFKPLVQNSHAIFELDYPIINDYKQKILQEEQPLCALKRISIDLNDPQWDSYLLKYGFSVKIPSFWILEGFAYYIEKKKFQSLLTKITKLSIKNSEIFVDMMHSSRWFQFPFTSDGITNDSFSKHFKWGIDLLSIHSFFNKNHWKVSGSFADDYDQGRNVGQKAMIFIHGVRI